MIITGIVRSVAAVILNEAKFNNFHHFRRRGTCTLSYVRNSLTKFGVNCSSRNFVKSESVRQKKAIKNGLGLWIGVLIHYYLILTHVFWTCRLINNWLDPLPDT